MIISVEDAKRLISFNGWSDARIQMKLDSIENTIRSYTNNNFQDRSRRAECSVDGCMIHGYVPGLNVGDTIQISESQSNEGLYVVESIEDDKIMVGIPLVDEPHILVTKIVYPPDIIDCVVALLEWSFNYGGKVGIKSETLSRHSVTYEDSATLFNGYPVGILNGLKLHVKARF